MIKINDKTTVKIENITQTGEGVGRIDHKTIFVEGAVPGDIAEVRIIADKKTYLLGECFNLIQASEQRTEPACPYFPECGGCQLMHINYQDQLNIKRQLVIDALTRIGGFEAPVVEKTIGMTHPIRYRNKAQYKVSKDGLGFYAKRSHDVIPIKDCLTEPENAPAVIEAFNRFIQTSNITLYNEKTRKGYLRGIVQRTSLNGDTMITVVINKEKVKLKDTMVQMILKAVPNVKSIYANINKAQSNAVMGRENILLYGEPKLTETLGECQFLISPNSFFQVNTRQTEVLYNQVKALAGLTGEEVVFDLYCGTGTIGIYLADQAKWVYGIEVVEDAIRDAGENARLNQRTNTSFFTGKSEIEAPKLVESGIFPDVIILDPPRKGCDEKLLSMIGDLKTKRLVYVSCNPATLARDLKILDGYGYEAQKIQPVDVFGQTGHVETVVLLSKLKTKKHINIELRTDEFDLTASESKATYAKIKQYVLEKHGIKVSSLNIAQIKQKCGIKERDNYNLSKKENVKQPQCTVEKEKAIMDAFRHFQMI